MAPGSTDRLATTRGDGATEDPPHGPTTMYIKNKTPVLTMVRNACDEHGASTPPVKTERGALFKETMISGRSQSLMSPQGRAASTTWGGWSGSKERREARAPLQSSTEDKPEPAARVKAAQKY